MRSMTARLLMTCAVVLTLAACSTTTTRLVPTAKPETGYRQITPPNAPHYALQPGQSAQLPQPTIGHFAPPAYPAALMQPGTPPVVVKAQVVFGADGHAQHAYILSNSYPGSEASLFADAVQAATSGWVFTPLVFHQYSNPAMAAGTLETTAKPFSLWFEFDFRVVDGKPVVETVKRR